MKLFVKYTFVIFLLLIMAGAASADELEVGGSSGVVGLTADKPYLHVMHEGRSVKVQRVQDADYELRGYFAKTVRKCPPFCIRPEQADPRVSTIGEVEIFEFMETKLRDGEGLLIDARTPQWHQRGTIPGSVNIPFTTLSKEVDAPEMVKALESFGVTRRSSVGFFTRKMEEMGFMDGELKSGKWNFSKAKDLVLWCNGPSCGQSPRAIKGLLKVGYPPERLFYYRGGMQLWQLWGLTTVIPNK